METRKGLPERGPATGRSLVHYLQDRQVGAQGQLAQRGFESQLNSLAARSLPHVLREHQLDLGTLDKVLASQWLNSREVVCGTMCNKLFRLDVYLGQITHCPLMVDREPAAFGLPGCGIQAIELNPSKTLLATRGKNPSSLAVYQLPTMDPVCLGDIQGHKDGIYAIAWVSDNVVVSGSHDGTLALWQLDTEFFYDTIDSHSSSGIPMYGHMHPADVVDVSSDNLLLSYHPVSALAFSSKNQELGSVSLDGYFRLWKPQTNLSSLFSFRLPFFGANACMTYCDEYSLYVVASSSYLYFLDPRQPLHNLKPLHYLKPLHCRDLATSVCSLSYNQDIITLGTVHGSLLFNDVRVQKFLVERCEVGQDSSAVFGTKILKLTCCRGWINQDTHRAYRNIGLNQVPISLYTHCYNWPDMKLFVAGGPNSFNLHGNYAGLWS
ncbi:DDB1- and CUL4-associated factor 12-like protein 2 [Ochotona curzoniae]|uniref:DDB1- and CUL4-associated factor 12-like protein 2 n=1 Tax=Ochotona curzoniae TaxID=130825 RepID=UPI001B35314C|nr:DDB1- and CUL4-associated factor 12-like protein 2 [Ochotona curzoniae]